MDRKEFLSKAFKLCVGKSLTLLEDNPIVNALERSTAELKPGDRPPGALPEPAFKQSCTGCDACMIACPVNVIMIENQESRLPIIYAESPCINCPDTPCITACKTGALINPK